MKEPVRLKKTASPFTAFMKRFMRSILFITLAVLAVCVCIVLILHIPRVQSLIGTRLIDYAGQSMNKTITWDSFGLSLAGKFEVNNLAIHHHPVFGHYPMISIKHLSIDFNPLSLAQNQILINNVTIEKPVFRILFDEKGHLNLRKSHESLAIPKTTPDDDVADNDDTELRKLLSRFRISQITLADGRFVLDHKPSGYFLDAPMIHLNGLFNDNKESLMVTVRGHCVHNTIPGQLESLADIRIHAEVSESGVKHSLVTMNSANGEVWLHSSCVLENYLRPRLTFNGTLRSNLSELETIVFLDQDIQGVTDLFFSGNGYAANLDIQADIAGRDIKFSQFRIANFRGSARYHDDRLTVTDSRVMAYDGELTASADIFFPKPDRQLHISADGFDINLAGLMEDLEIPLLLSTRSDVGFLLTSDAFKADTFVLTGHLSGYETSPYMHTPDRDTHWTPLHISADYFFRQGRFGISEARITHADHEISLSDSVFAKDTLAGSIRGNTVNLPDLLERIDRMTLLDVNVLDIEGGADFTAILGGTTAEYVISAHLGSQTLVFRNEPLDALDVSVIVYPSRIMITESTVSGSGIQTKGSLHIDLPAPDSASNLRLKQARFDIDYLDVAFLNSFLELDQPIAGSAKGTLNVCDLPESPSCTSSLTISDFVYANIPSSEVNISAFVTPSGVFDASVAARSGLARVDAEGNFPFSGIPDFKLEASDIPWTLVPGMESVDMDGRISVTAKSEPDGSDLVIRYHATSLNSRFEHYELKDIDIKGFVYTADPPRVTWDAVLDQEMIVSSGQFFVTAPFRFDTETRLTAFPLSIISDFVDQQNETSTPFDGVISLNTSLQGRINDFNSITGPIQIEQLVFNVQDMTFTLEEPRILTLENSVVIIPSVPVKHDWMSFETQGKVDTRGSIELSGKGQVDMASLDSISDFFSETRGVGRFDLTLKGPWDDPDVFGDLYIQEFFTYLPLFLTNLEDYHGNIRFNQKIARIRYMEGLAGGSYFGGTGEFGISRYLPNLLDIRFSGTDIELEYPRGFQSTANVDLGVTGNLPDVNISGLIDVRQAMYSARVNYKTMIVNESRAKLSLMERRPALRASDDASTGFNPSFNLTIRARDGIMIDNNIARVEMSMRLDILGTLLRPRVLGHIDVLRGEVTFLQRSFELLSASIDFADPSKIDPLISLQAGTTIDDHHVSLDISGNLYSDINIRPSSTPPLNEIDLWNLLVIGKTRDQMASSDDYLAGGVAYVTGSLQEQIERRFEYWIGFDEFSIDPVMSTYDESPSARFTAKKRFGPDLSVLYSRSATSTEDLLLIEYRMSDNLFIIGHKKEDNSIGADIRYRWEFD